MSSFKDLISNIEELITASYEEGIAVDDAERLASRLLVAQIQVSNELRKMDLDSRMRKSGVKAVRAAIYLGEARADLKKPSDVLINAVVDANKLVQDEQNRFDEAEVGRDELERIYNVFGAAHIHFRNVAKGSFN